MQKIAHIVEVEFLVHVLVIVFTEFSAHSKVFLQLTQLQYYSLFLFAVVILLLVIVCCALEVFGFFWIGSVLFEFVCTGCDSF